MASLFRKLSTFFNYLVYMVNTFIDVTNANDLILSLGLYVIYPAILFLLIDKFHGVCGAAFFLRKKEAIAANNSIFLVFTTLLRTSKLLHIIIYSVDADAKSGSQRDLEVVDSDDEEEGDSRPGNTDGALLAKLKVKTWMQLSRELMAVGIPAAFLLFCLPVLAFWFMFLHILLSIWTLYSLIKRLWKDSQDSSWGQGEDGYDDDEEGNGGDVEFQEFLSNFGEDEKDNA